MPQACRALWDSSRHFGAADQTVCFGARRNKNDLLCKARGYNRTCNVTASLPVGNDSRTPGGAVAHPARPRLGEGGRTARACQRSPPGAAGRVCSAELPAAPLGAALAAVLLLRLGCLPPKHGGAHSPAVHPGSSLLVAEEESKLSPHPGLGVGSRCGVGGYGPWQKTSC